MGGCRIVSTHHQVAETQLRSHEPRRHDWRREGLRGQCRPVIEFRGDAAGIDAAKQRLDGPERCVLRSRLRDDDAGGTKPIDQEPEFVIVGDSPANICEIIGGARMQIDPPALRIHAQRYGAIRSLLADAKP